MVLFCVLLNVGLAHLLYPRYFRRVGKARAWWNSYLALGVLTFLVCLLAIWMIDNSLRLALLVPILATGPALLLVDCATQKLPNLLNLSLALLSLAMLGFYAHTTGSLVKPLMALIVAGAFSFLFAPATFIRRGVGLGDLKLMVPLIALTTCWSWHVLLMMIIYAGFGLGLWSLLLLRLGKIEKYDRLAMGPWLLGAAYLGFLSAPL